MKHWGMTVVIASVGLLGACNTLPDETGEADETGEERYQITKAEGRTLEADVLGETVTHVRLDMDPLAVQVVKCGATKACVQIATQNLKPGVTPTDPPAGGSGGPFHPPGGGNKDACLNNYLACMEWCYDNIPHLPIFAGLYFGCVTSCSAGYATCLAEAAISGGN